MRKKNIDNAFHVLEWENKSIFVVNICGEKQKQIIQTFISFNTLKPINNCYRLVFGILPGRINVSVTGLGYPLSMNIKDMKLLLKILYYLPGDAMVDYHYLPLFKNALIRSLDPPNPYKTNRLHLYNTYI